MTLNERECEAAGIDPVRVRNLAKRLERIGREMQRLGIGVFGGSGTGTLRGTDNLILASIDAGHWDGKLGK